MPSAKPLPSVSCLSRRSALRLLEQHIASEPAAQSGNESKTSQVPLPRQVPPQRSISSLIGEFFAFAVHAVSAHPNVLVAITSWLFSEFCAGCAAYAQAMYPTFPPEDDVERGKGVQAAVPYAGNAPAARTVSAAAERGIDTKGVIAFPAFSRPASRNELGSWARPPRTGSLPGKIRSERQE